MDKKIEIKKTIEIIKKSISAQWLFLLALSIYFMGEVLSTTMFPIPEIFKRFFQFAGIGLAIWKIVQFDCFSLKEIFFITVLFINVLLVKIFSGYSERIYWVIFLVGAKNVSFEKILKSYFVVSLSIMLFAFSASLLKIIENLQYNSDNRGIRNSFGIIYPTDFAAHVFFLMLVFLYLKKSKVKICDYIICLIISVFIYCFCKTRLDCICMVLLIAGHMLIKYGVWGKKHRKKKQKKKSISMILGMYSMPTAFFIMWLLTVLYNLGVPIAYDIDYWISNRLRLQSQGMMEYGFRLFGQYVYMNGNGRSVILPVNYFFIDCSYFYVILQFGALFGILIFAIYAMCCRKNKEDSFFHLTIVMIAINCMIAHHLLSLAYNPFSMALFAKSSYELYIKDREILNHKFGISECSFYY